MKKLKSVLCSILVLMFGAVLLSACSAGNNIELDEDSDNVNSVAVNEAKTAIINALIFEDDYSFGYDNRNIYEKFGKFKGKILMDEISTGNIFNAEYCNGHIAGLLLTGDDSDFYYDGSKQYSYNHSHKSVECYVPDSEFNSLYSLGASALDETKLFSDDMFVSYYKNAEKSVFDDYYMWTLYVPYKQAMNLIGQSGNQISDSLRSDYLKVYVLFDENNQIIKFKYVVPYENNKGQVVFFSMEVSKSSDEINVPQWYTSYIASQN